MSNPGDADATPISSVRQLADHIAEGCKPRDRFTIGTEHEKFGYRQADLLPPPYEPGGIRALLEAMAVDGWTPILDAGNPIGLKRGSASVSLEPAGQLELSGGMTADLHETRAEFDTHFAHVRKAAGGLGLAFAPLGFHPTRTRAQCIPSSCPRGPGVGESPALPGDAFTWVPCIAGRCLGVV